MWYIRVIPTSCTVCISLHSGASWSWRTGWRALPAPWPVWLDRCGTNVYFGRWKFEVSWANLTITLPVLGSRCNLYENKGSITFDIMGERAELSAFLSRGISRCASLIWRDVMQFFDVSHFGETQTLWRVWCRQTMDHIQGESGSNPRS